MSMPCVLAKRGKHSFLEAWGEDKGGPGDGDPLVLGYLGSQLWEVTPKPKGAGGGKWRGSAPTGREDRLRER